MQGDQNSAEHADILAVIPSRKNVEIVQDRDVTAVETLYQLKCCTRLHMSGS